MRSHAKAESAFTHGRSGVVALAIAAVALLALAPLAFASKGGDSFIGSTITSGISGGQFNAPADIAVHQSTGQIYVADRLNHRIQRFSSAGVFQRAWGMDVVSGGATGTGTLTNGSTSITSVVTTSKAFVVGQTITGTGIPAGTRITAVGSGTITLSQAATAGGSGVAITAVTDAANVPTNEQQTVTVTAIGGNFKLAYTTPNPSPTTAAANTTVNIPFDAAAAEVQTALENLGNIGAGNVAVTSPNPTGGPYTVTFQGTRFADTNVTQMTVAAGSPALTGGTATVATAREGAAVFERCTDAVSCKAGIATGGNPNDKLANGGLSGPYGVAIDEDTGNVYVTDNVNNRVNAYDADGAFIRSFGWDVVAPGEPSEASEFFDEIQSVSLTSLIGGKITGGAFTLTFNGQTTAGIAYDADGAAVQSALVALSNIGPADVSVTGPNQGPWTVTFEGSLGETNVPAMTGNKGTLEENSGPGTFASVIISTSKEGGPGPAYEVCPAAERCKAGTSGTAVGQFTSSGLGRLAVSPPDGDPASGFVYAADSGGTLTSPKRVLRFKLDGTLAPSPVIQLVAGGAPFPWHVAVDAGGILYATSTNNTIIFRYDPAANGGSGGFLAPLDLTALDATSATSGAVQGLEIDPSNGHLLAVVDPSTGDTVVEEIANPGGESPSLFDTHMKTGTGNVSLGGLGAVHSGAGDRLYVSAQAGAIGHRLLVLDNDGGGAPPSLTVSPPTNVGHNQATFHGTVNPNGPTGFETSYRFEYSKNGVAWTAANATTLVGDDAVDHPVSATASGLEANTFYRVRLVTTRAFNAGATTSAELTFLTDAVAPALARQDAQNSTDTGAVLSATINPNGKPTSYYVEYGKTSAYDAKAPLADASIAGGLDKYVTETVAGLEPETTYHFRFVASNEEGTTRGPDQIFVTRSPLTARAARAYEQVSAVDKNGYSILPYGVPAAATGDAIIYRSIGSFAGAGYGLFNDAGEMFYGATRGPEGWTTQPLIPRGADGSGQVKGEVDAVEGGAGRSVITFASNSLNPDSNNHRGGLYKHDILTRADTELVRTPAADNNESRVPRLVGASADLSRVFFTSPEVLTDDVGIPASGRKLYEVFGGQTKLVALDTSNVPFASAVGVGSASANAVSGDGNHIFFSTPDSGNGMQVYRRSNAAVTRLASPSKRTPADPSGAKAKEFLGATPGQGAEDPAMVFFASSEQLTNNANTGPSRAGKDLYRYDVNADSLVDVSAEANTTNGARVQGVLGYSDDGKWVYYVGLGRVVAGKGVDGQPNLYLWHDDGTAGGATRFLATLSGQACVGSDGFDFGLTDACNYLPAGHRSKVSRVSPDGQSLLFQSTMPLTGYPNGGLNQAFLYEADGNGGAGALSCVSCPEDGSPLQGNARLATFQKGSPASGSEPVRSLLPDGDVVFFNSPAALVPEDVNGRLDAYEWREGHVSLISPGTDTTLDNAFINASRDGRDVFFSTRSGLVGQDRDSLVDIYDARVGGGIPAQSPPPPGEPCAGEACKPAPQTQASQAAPQSASSGSSGNVAAKAPGKPGKKCAKGKVRRGNRCVAKRVIAQQSCRKRKGAAKRRCVANQVRRLNRTANADRRAAR